VPCRLEKTVCFAATPPKVIHWTVEQRFFRRAGHLGAASANMADTTIFKQTLRLKKRMNMLAPLTLPSRHFVFIHP
jgi:hypothetical protein